MTPYPKELKIGMIAIINEITERMGYDA